MLIAQFIEYLQSERKLSAHTTLAYEQDLQEFQNFVNPSTLDQIKKTQVKSYLAFLISNKLQERSINRKLSAIKSFYKFLMLTETIQHNPTERIKTLKHSKKVQIPYSTTEINQLLENVAFPDDFIGIRDQLIISMLYHTGMRKAELISLQTQNIDLDKKELKVLGKRNKERILPFNAELAQAIQNYMDVAQNQGIDLQGHFFVNEKNKELYPKLVYNVVNNYLSLVTEKSKKSPHMLRHTFATHILQNGAEINAVKEILGHSNLVATQVYTHADIAQLKKVFNHSHPRENKK